MAQILIRGLDASVVAQLKKQAYRDGRSLQSEVKAILEQAAQMNMHSALQLARDIRNKFKERKFGDSADIIRKERER